MKVYLCKEDLNYLEDIHRGTTVYPTLEAYETNCSCAHSGCGIVECELSLVKVIEDINPELQLKTCVSLEQGLRDDVVSLEEGIARMTRKLEETKKALENLDLQGKCGCQN